MAKNFRFSIADTTHKPYLYPMTVHQFPKRPQKQTPQKEKMLNVEDPAPFMLAIVFVLCHIGLMIAPVSFKNFVYQACVLTAQGGSVFLEGRPLGNISTLITHGFLHTGWVDVLMNAAFVIAFGIITIRGAAMKDYPILGMRRGAAVFFGVFFAGIVVGALAQWVFWVVLGGGVMIGASAGVSALFATTAYAMGGRQYLMSFGVLVIGMQLLSLTMGGAPTWPAQVFGYVAGAVLAMRWISPNSASMGMFR